MTDQNKPTEAPEPVEATAAKQPMSERVDQAREKFAEVAGGVQKKARDIGKGAEEASKQVRETAEKASEVARERYGDAVEKVRVGYDRARKDMDHLAEDVNEYVRDNPGRSVLIAAGVGFVVGLLLRGGRHHD